MTAVRILRSAAHLSLGEFFASYPPKLYFISWAPRSLFGLLFFAFLAQFLGGPEYLSFVVIGSVAHAAWIGSLIMTVSAVGREQDSGTVPLLVASPSSPVWVLVGRSAANLGNGVLIAGLTLALATVLLGLPMTGDQLAASLGILVVMCASVCALGLAVGSMALRIPEYRNTISNGSGIALVFVTGAYVPVEWLPEWIRPLSEALPVTHGLRALRALTTSSPYDIRVELMAEAGVGILMLLIALGSFALFLRAARVRGTLDFH